jgi:glycosyltransferase involved in cell wall biosynthesis
MKILMVIPSFLPEVAGGAENAVYNISNALSQRGHEVDILTFNLERRWKPNFRTEINHFGKLKVIRWGSINPWRLFEHTRISNFFQRIFGIHLIPQPGLRRLYKQYDVIHFNDEVNLTFPIFSLFYNAVPRVFQHRTLIQKLKFLHKSPVSRFILRNCADISLIDTEAYREHVQAIGIPDSRIYACTKGVDTARFEMSPNKELEKDLLTFVGRLDDRLKGAHILLEALERAQYKGPVKIIAGKFSPNRYFEDIQNKILRLTEKGFDIEILGYMVQDELIQWYQRSRIFVHPALEDSMPNTVLEAMSCEAICIISKTGGLTNIAQNRDCVIGVEPNNAVALSEALKNLMAASQNYSQFGKNARELVCQEFSYNNYIDSFVDLYKKLQSG